MGSAFYLHHKLVPESEWHWPSFRPIELASRGNESLFIDYRAMDALQCARELCGKPFIINSAYRDELHNANVGGSPLSYHLEGKAFDISLQNHNKEFLIRSLVKAGFKGIGKSYSSFVHADTGTPYARRW